MSDEEDDSPREKVPIIHKCDNPSCPKGTPPTTMRCSRCKEAYYCDEECQKADYNVHKGSCIALSKRALSRTREREESDRQLRIWEARQSEHNSQEFANLMSEYMYRMPEEYRDLIQRFEEAKASAPTPLSHPPGVGSYGVGMEIPLAAMASPSAKKIG
jgi:hypothetical protein